MIAKDYIDILAIDHYPCTWTGTGANDWRPLDSLISICNKYDKKGAIMETGFSTYGSEDTPWGFPGYEHTQDDQEIFINNALPIIREKAYNQNVNNPGKEIILASWYELRGSDPTTWWYGYVEENFGILHDNLSFKRGYDDLQKQIAEYWQI